MESASNTDMTNYRGNSHRVYHGRMMVYLQTTGAPGDAEVTFSAPWLISGKVTLSVE
jgi:beta-galactosidase